ncbi:class I SAM-dependent DNA methyltransferase [Amycolatopsis regifaucium]|uniref:Methyltransferase n=1 Tax=Amycolatopsis regifaucium TaxID=546365 RepID=A0A154MRN4_9PSEU|nr:class I SAM-dependent methyltransferase [Amycolatopsis regifaucium]KZB86603.1 methyltransferase [Amycolatopsis regifaucium]OKA03550.1 SAM-dependent methyltransferase [Amycolatopsis regifaucium]
MTDYLDSTRTAYDTVAADYAELLRDHLAGSTWDRAMLGAYAELVQAAGKGRVAEIGCGPGRITEYLHSLGLDIYGVDLSPEMLAVARKWYPHLEFQPGEMPGLSIEDGALTGVVAWYSIIHTPRERLPEIFTDFHRILASGGHLLLAFQVGDEVRHIEHAYGHDISCDAYRLPPEKIAAQLGEAGFTVISKLVREPSEEFESTPQAYLIARKP